MNLTFCYILAGWEGLVHDDRLLEDMLFTRDFKIPNGKYYFADIRHYNMDNLLYPYCDVCYYLKEQAIAGKKAVNKKKLFNLFHSIRKLYLALIQLTDPGFTQSTLIYSRIFLIYLRVPQPALLLIRCKQEPVFWS